MDDIFKTRLWLTSVISPAIMAAKFQKGDTSLECKIEFEQTKARKTQVFLCSADPQGMLVQFEDKIVIVRSVDTILNDDFGEELE